MFSVSQKAQGAGEAHASLSCVVHERRKCSRSTSVPGENLVELKVGDLAPEFSLMNEQGLPVSLKDYLGKNTVVLYFYPKDFTSGCTTEACSFRDNYKLYQDKGAVVIGVSVDSVESHSKFSEKYALPFAILSDTGKEVAKA